MGILGTDYTLRSGQVIFLLLLTSSVLLGFSYVNEMYQRIQLQEKMERETQLIVSERRIMQHKASLLQTQIESRNKEMKRMQDIHEFQAGQRNLVCEKGMNDLLQTISSKDNTITEAQNQYENLKHRFEHLQFLMEQFETNQSRLLEKFSTQSTQCMNVINKLSQLCNKGNIIRKIAQVKMQDKTSNERPITQSSTMKASISTSLVSAPQGSYTTNEKHSTEFSRPPTKDTTPESGHGKQSSPKAVQTLRKMVSELNNPNSTKDNEDEVIKLEKIQNSTPDNVFKSLTEESGKDDEKDLPKYITTQETVISKKETTEQQTRRNEQLPALNETSEFEKLNGTKNESVHNPQHPMLLSTNESIQLISEHSRTADRDVFTKEELTDKPIENITMAEDKMKSEAKHTTQTLTLEKMKTTK